MSGLWSLTETFSGSPVKEADIFFDYMNVFSPVVCFALNIAMQITSLRLSAKLGLLKSIVLGFAAGLAVLLLIFGYFYFALATGRSDLIYSSLVGLIVYSSLGYCYFHFINLGETARRIRILREIYDSASGLPMDELTMRYNSEEIIKARLGRLLGNGQIIDKKGRYFIGKPAMLLISRILIVMKVFVLGKKSEFD